jgi:diguanylate cyclase (GGDEF)-like protein
MSVSPTGDQDRLAGEVVAHLVAYMERTTDLVGVADDRGNVMYLNQAARDRLGVGAGSDRTLTTDDLFPNAAFDIYYEQIRPRLLMGETWSGYVPVRGGGGEPLDMWVTVVGEVLPGGEVAWLVITARDVTEWRHVHDEPLRHATHDELTGVATRTLLMDHTDIALARARRSGVSVAMMFVDLDNLKAINDSFGHQTGDLVLIEVARRLRDAVRAIDTVARVGGDEFVVLFDGVDDDLEAETLATRVHAILESAPIDADGTLVNVSASAGIAVSRGNEGGHQLLGRADTAMYDVKGDRREVPCRSRATSGRTTTCGRSPCATWPSRSRSERSFRTINPWSTSRPARPSATRRWRDGCATSDRPDRRRRSSASSRVREWASPSTSPCCGTPPRRSWPDRHEVGCTCTCRRDSSPVRASPDSCRRCCTTRAWAPTGWLWWCPLPSWCGAPL